MGHLSMAMLNNQMVTLTTWWTHQRLIAATAQPDALPLPSPPLWSVSWSLQQGLPWTRLESTVGAAGPLLSWFTCRLTRICSRSLYIYITYIYIYITYIYIYIYIYTYYTYITFYILYIVYIYMKMIMIMGFINQLISRLQPAWLREPPGNHPIHHGFVSRVIWRGKGLPCHSEKCWISPFIAKKHKKHVWQKEIHHQDELIKLFIQVFAQIWNQFTSIWTHHSQNSGV